MKIDILTEEEYMQIKDPTYTIRKFLKKKNNEKLQKIQAEINRLENIIDLSYDKNGKPVFKSINDIVKHNLDEFIKSRNNKEDNE